MKRSGEPAVTALPWDEPFAGIGLYGMRHAVTNAGTAFLALVGESRGSARVQSSTMLIPLFALPRSESFFHSG